MSFQWKNKEVVWLLSLTLKNCMTHGKCSTNVILVDERSVRTIILVFSGQTMSLKHSCLQALAGITVIYSAAICASIVQGVGHGTVNQTQCCPQGAYNN